MCKFNSFSPGQKAIHVGITRGFMKTPGFRPSPAPPLIVHFGHEVFGLSGSSSGRRCSGEKVSLARKVDLLQAVILLDTQYTHK